jgi:MFS family permease
MTGELLRNRNFRLLWLGQIVSDFGDSVTIVTLLILVNRLTGSTAAMAAMSIVLAIPQVTLGMVAGVYVDRLDRKRIMILSDLLRAIFVLGFIFVTSVDMLWLVYGIGLIQASVGVFFTPARSALIPTLVPREQLLAANSLSQTSRVIAGVVGVSAAGLLIGTFDVFWPLFIVDSLTFFTSLALISFITTPRHIHEAVGSVRVIFGDLMSGVTVILNTRILAGTLVGAGITMLGMGAVNVLLIPFTLNELHVTESWLGALEFAQTLSMILAGALMAVLAARVKPPHILSIGMVILGVLTGLFAIAFNVWHILFILFGIGWLVTPIHASIATLMQTNTPDALRGRAGAALSMMAATTNVLSMGFAGLFGDIIGIRSVFILSGVIVVLAGIASAWVFSSEAVRAPVLHGENELI